jgi:hypothetical protein
MTTDETTTGPRDEELGALLRELDAPEHGARFHAELRRQLDAERSGAVRRTRLRWGVRVGALAAVAAIAVVAIGVPRTDRTPRLAGPETATAAVVKARLRSALEHLRNLSGTLVASGPAQGREARWRFTLDAAGDVRLEGPSKGEAITYDASTGVVRSAQRSASLGGDTLFYAQRDGVAPGPPDQGPPTWILPDEFADYVRAALAAGNPAVHEVVFDGRPAWRLDVTTIPNAIAPELSGDRFEITVDRRTGLPVRVDETKQGKLLRALRIVDLAVDRTLRAGTFRLAFPARAEVMRSDDGFRRVPLDAAAAAVGYRPLLPTALPAGYRLAQVAVADEGSPTGKEGGNPPSRSVVSLSYRRGLDQVVVTTRLRDGGTWSDPLASPEGFVDEEQPLAVASGALARADAHLLVSPHAVPHVWALTGKLVVTIGGDLSRAELARAAGSLEER